MGTEEVLTAPELAKALKVKLPTIRKWQRDGAPCIPAGRLRRYLLSDFILWLRQREAGDKKAA